MASDGALRFPLRSTTRRTLPILLILGLAGFLFAGRAAFAVAFGVISVLNIAFWYLSRTGRHVLVLDDAGYRVEVDKREKFRVAWSEVTRVQAMPAEEVMHLDCGDPARNLLLPPRFGHGYTYEKQNELYALLAQRFGDRVEINDKLLEAHAPKRPA